MASGKQLRLEKIRAFELITKIQEAKPAYESDLVNKELSYDVVVQLQGEDTETIRNCICSARPNSDLFKRLSKKFISNIRSGVDQMFLFCGLQAQPRLQTAIGIQSNPGLFLMVALTLLDEKYREGQTLVDVQFSFLQFRDGNIYDLLNYTQAPLKPIKCKRLTVTFGEHAVKVSTFGQFLKLFKVALFNNRERDFKSDSKPSGLKTSFLMRCKYKVYSEKESLLREQQTVMIDYEPNTQKQDMIVELPRRHTLNLRSSQFSASSKPLWQHILVELNNFSPNTKPIHYHLVEESALLLLVRSFLKKSVREGLPGGQVTIVNTFASNKARFKDNLQYTENICTHIDEKWETKVTRNVPLKQPLDLGGIESAVSALLKGISHRTYASIRQFHNLKVDVTERVNQLCDKIKSFTKLAVKLVFAKASLHLLITEMVANQLAFIGGCVKSDHFKDFYSSRSYLLLSREIQIKTENVKQEIDLQHLTVRQVQNQFTILRKCKNLLKKKPQLPSVPYESAHILPSRPQQVKFRKVAENYEPDCHSSQLDELSKKVQQYVEEKWESILLNTQRTLVEQLLVQDVLQNEQNQIISLLTAFVQQLALVSERQVSVEQENCHFLPNWTLASDSTHFREISLRKMLSRLKIRLDRITPLVQQGKQKQKAWKPLAQQKLKEKTQNIVVSGELRMVDLLLCPQQGRETMDRSQ